MTFLNGNGIFDNASRNVSPENFGVCEAIRSLAQTISIACERPQKAAHTLTFGLRDAAYVLVRLGSVLWTYSLCPVALDNKNDYDTLGISPVSC
jgi:hypothetical protein